MTPTATPTPPLSRPTRRYALQVLAVFLALPLLLLACEILEVLQPSEADQGETIEVTATIGEFTDDSNPHKGILSVLVPEDWTFVSGTYDGPNSGDMIEDEGWADSTEAVLPAPDGMKWISAISDEGYAVASADVYDATLRLQVGQEVGDFGLGYFVTTDAFAIADIDLDPDGGVTADTAMNQPITVNLMTAGEEGPGAGAFTLMPNAPNPFREATEIRYSLARAASVRVTVFDVKGQQVAVFDRGTQPSGDHSVDFQASGLASGTYLCQLTVDGEVVDTHRMTLAR